MKSTTEITMRGEQTRLERLLGRIETSLRGGWKRDPAEERLGRHGAPADPGIVAFPALPRPTGPPPAFGFMPAAPTNCTSPP